MVGFVYVKTDYRAHAAPVRLSSRETSVAAPRHEGAPARVLQCLQAILRD